MYSKKLTQGLFTRKGLFTRSISEHDLTISQSLLQNIIIFIFRKMGQSDAKSNSHVKRPFTLGLQVYNANNKFLYSKMNQLIAKSRSEIGRVNKPLNFQEHLVNSTELYYQRQLLIYMLLENCGRADLREQAQIVLQVLTPTNTFCSCTKRMFA